MRNYPKTSVSVTGRSAGGGGGTTELFYAGATLSVQGGQELVASSSVYGIKRSATLAEATSFPNLHYTARATSSISGGSVSGTTITTPGAGYTTAPSVTFSAAPSGGTTATGTATLGAKFIDAIQVTNCGEGVGTVSFSIIGGGGSGASAAAIVVGGKLVGVRVVNGGRGYTSAPTITVNAPGATTLPVVEPIMSKDDGVISINVTNPGSGYTSAPTITIANAPFIPSNPTTIYPDYFGWARVTQSVFGATTPTVGSILRVVNDLGSAFPYALYIGELLLTFHNEYRRLATEDVNARGCVEVWVPDGVIG